MTRDDLYQRFGPLLIEAIVLVFQDEINVLRTKARLPEKTDQQLIDAIDIKLSGCIKYSWMNGQIGV